VFTGIYNGWYASYPAVICQTPAWACHFSLKRRAQSIRVSSKAKSEKEMLLAFLQILIYRFKVF